jgi:hypothetical protein
MKYIRRVQQRLPQEHKCNMFINQHLDAKTNRSSPLYLFYSRQTTALITNYEQVPQQGQATRSQLAPKASRFLTFRRPTRLNELHSGMAPVRLVPSNRARSINRHSLICTGMVPEIDVLATRKSFRSTHRPISVGNVPSIDV